jgi:hypothetical protein
MTHNKNVQILVHNWNPNGTNDIEILVDGETVDSIPEALFGLNIGPPASALGLRPIIYTLLKCCQFSIQCPFRPISVSLKTQSPMSFWTHPLVFDLT